MPARISDLDRIDRFISTAPRDALVRLQSEVSAALKYRDFSQPVAEAPAPAKRQRKATKEQSPLPLGEESAK